MGTGVEGKAKEEMKNMENMPLLMTSVGCSALDFGVKIQCKPVTHSVVMKKEVKTKEDKPLKLEHGSNGKPGEEITNIYHAQVPAKVYICPTCGESFIEKTDFANHKKVVHGENTGAEELEEFGYNTSSSSNTSGTYRTTAINSVGSSTGNSYYTEEV